MTDQVSTWIAPVGAAVAFMVGVVQFGITTAQKNREPFLKKQLELCCLASETAAQLAPKPTRLSGKKLGNSFGDYTGDNWGLSKTRKWRARW